MTDIEALAREAAEALFMFLPYEVTTMHGIELAPGFFNVYNNATGQSKRVVLHPESGCLFKTVWADPEIDVERLSGRYLGTVNFEDGPHLVRLPNFDYIYTDNGIVEVQEYVIGESCDCDSYRDCRNNHTAPLAEVTQCYDTHRGNWKMTASGEIVLFDFDGIRV